MSHKIMTITKFKRILLAIMSILLLSSSSTLAFAAPNATECPGGEGDSMETTFMFNGKGGDSGKKVCISDLIAEFMKFLTGLAGIAAVVGIVFGGIKISMAQGNPGQLDQGVKAILNAVLGIVVYILMFAIINFMVPGGILR
jgi:hypothetical protein